MECGMEYGMDYGTHLAYHKHANYVALPINYPLPVQKDEVIAVIIYVHVCVQKKKRIPTAIAKNSPL